MPPQPTDAGVLVIVPTYNERDNIEMIVERLFAALPDVHVLIVDDASPDGTGKIAEAISADDPRVDVLHRHGKAGLGAAYIAGFTWGLERRFGVLVEMDADGSHAPEQLPQLVAALDHADLVLGSRWIDGGRVVLDTIDYRAVVSEGYCFQVDLVWRAVRAGFRVVEVPITFAERERGDSKMSRSIVREALWRVTEWGVKHRTQQVRDLVRGRP